MRIRAYALTALLAALLGGVLWYADRASEEGAPAFAPVPLPGGAAAPAAPYSSDALLPLPPVPELPARKVALGRRLFQDKRLSHDDSIACASCHDLEHGGVDHRPVSVGIDGRLGTVNAPTVFNASLNFVQFWDGRAPTLEAQAAGPVHNPLEMASNWDEVTAKLGRDEDYVREFARLYPPSGLTGAAIADAIATFERTLLTPDSRFDRFLRGDRTALDAEELAGYRRFVDFGCSSCHQGAAIGGNMFQNFGVLDDYFRGRKEVKSDLGRFNVTGRPEDRHVFKVPGLRNVAVTAPYFHDGSAPTLEDAVMIMGRYQLGRDLSNEDVAALVAFLRTLTGQWQGRPLQ